MVSSTFDPQAVSTKNELSWTSFIILSCKQIQELYNSKALSRSIILNLVFLQSYPKIFQHLISKDGDKKNVVKLLKQSPVRYHKKES